VARAVEGRGDFAFEEIVATAGQGVKDGTVGARVGAVLVVVVLIPTHRVLASPPGAHTHQPGAHDGVVTEGALARRDAVVDQRVTEGVNGTTRAEGEAA
jgi:hypothetical protein